ncbi:MAG: PAS domain-containing protein, partial [Candidatus Kapaibacterium sp.]
MIKNKGELIAFLDAVPTPYMILNKQRQIIFANKSTLILIKADNPDAIIGMRPGDALRCRHAIESEHGCGTTVACQSCGAVRAILSSLNQVPDIQDCRIEQIDSGDSFDLRVWTTP